MSWVSILKAEEEKPEPKTNPTFFPPKGKPMEKKKRKSKRKDAINKYALKIRDILSKYNTTGGMSQDIVSEIKQSTNIFRNTQLPNIFHVFSTIGSEKIDELKSSTDSDLKPIQRRLSANYGGDEGYALLEKIYDSIPEMRGRRMNPKLREDLTVEFTTAKKGFPTVVKDMETLEEFKFENNEKGIPSLVALKRKIEDTKKIVDEGESSLPSDEIEEYRKKKDQIKQRDSQLKDRVADLLREIRPRDSLKFMRFLDDMTERNVISGEARSRPVKVEGKDLQMKIPREFTELRSSAREYGFDINPKQARMILTISKAKAKLQEAKDELSKELEEMERNIKATSSGGKYSLSELKEFGEFLVEGEKTLNYYTLMVENNLDTLEENLTEFEGDGMDVIRESAKAYLPVLKKYINIAEELNLYVDQDAREYVELLDSLLSTRMIDFDLDSALSDVREGEKDE